MLVGRLGALGARPSGGGRCNTLLGHPVFKELIIPVLQASGIASSSADLLPEGLREVILTTTGKSTIKEIIKFWCAINVVLILVLILTLDLIYLIL